MWKEWKLSVILNKKKKNTQKQINFVKKMLNWKCLYKWKECYLFVCLRVQAYFGRHSAHLLAIIRKTARKIKQRKKTKTRHFVHEAQKGRRAQAQTLASSHPHHMNLRVHANTSHHTPPTPPSWPEQECASSWMCTRGCKRHTDTHTQHTHTAAQQHGELIGAWFSSLGAAAQHEQNQIGWLH